MIGRSARELSMLFDSRLEEDFQFKSHVFPGYSAPVIGMREGVRMIKPYRFGLIPHFEKNEKPKIVLHNARVETLHEKAAFRRVFSKQRCLIPLDSFFEYLTPAGEKRGLFRIFSRSGAILVAAGLYSRWCSPGGDVVSSFTMITRPAAPEIMSAGHDRSPYFLLPSVFDDWLSGKGEDASRWYGVLEGGREDPEFEMERVSSKSV
ncbi:MAG: SOS response-associated peptidase family protein [Bdellovibrionales bacterium]|nr:SOS response-associated peptidase family protein [Bdellovibrionales bacterium]